MSRAVRLEFPGAIYHVMALGRGPPACRGAAQAGMPTFLDDEDRRAFLGILDGLVDRGALEVHAFCLMRNHYHLLVRTPGGALSRCLPAATRRMSRRRQGCGM